MFFKISKFRLESDGQGFFSIWKNATNGLGASGVHRRIDTQTDILKKKKIFRFQSPKRVFPLKFRNRFSAALHSFPYFTYITSYIRMYTEK